MRERETKSMSAAKEKKRTKKKLCWCAFVVRTPIMMCINLWSGILYIYFIALDRLLSGIIIIVIHKLNELFIRFSQP